MGGGSPPDNSDKVAAIEANAAREARLEQERREAQQRRDFNQRLGGAYSTGLETAKQYFASRGLNPDDYLSSITTAANAARSSVPVLDESPGTYFNNLGQVVYDQQKQAKQAQALRGVNSIFGDGYATSRVTNDLDDAAINSILTEQQGTAEDYVRNLLDRGVITSSGFDAALKNVQRQKATANARLNEIGTGLLEGGRSKLNTIANEGRSKASNIDLGDIFDPASYSSRADAEFSSWLQGLGENLRAAAPSDLFSTSGLAGVAGAAQGAQNTKFDPNALAGIFGSEDEDKNKNNTPNSPF